MDKLVMEDITKVYGKGNTTVKALDSVSLQVKAGEFIAIVGPSGSGKTTFLSIAGALLQPTAGKILIDGKDISNFSSSKLAAFRLENLGFILQSSNLVPYLSAKDQLLLVAEMAGKRNKHAVEKANLILQTLGLGDRVNHYPESMSGGEKQRVAIARALMNDPQIILADEPTASLDSVRGREVVEMLAREVKTRNKAAVMVTHDERMLDVCDRIVRIEDGKIKEVISSSKERVLLNI